MCEIMFPNHEEFRIVSRIGPIVKLSEKSELIYHDFHRKDTKP